MGNRSPHPIRPRTYMCRLRWVVSLKALHVEMHIAVTHFRSVRFEHWTQLLRCSIRWGT